MGENIFWTTFLFLWSHFNLFTRRVQYNTHTHTHASFCTLGKMKTSVGVRLKFISVCQAQAKNDLTAHYFDKFGARDREEMEERGRKVPHTPHTR